MRNLVLAALAFGMGTLAAKADQVTNFTVSGTGTIYLASNTGGPNQPQPNGVASGTFSYDFTTNTVMANEVSLTDGVYNSHINFSPLVNPPAQPCIVGPNTNYYCDYGALTTSGGSFVVLDDSIDGSAGRVIQAYTGTFAVAGTPEPSSLYLLGSGLLTGWGFVARRRAGPARR